MLTEFWQIVSEFGRAYSSFIEVDINSHTKVLFSSSCLFWKFWPILKKMPAAWFLTSEAAPCKFRNWFRWGCLVGQLAGPHRTIFIKRLKYPFDISLLKTHKNLTFPIGHFPEKEDFFNKYKVRLSICRRLLTNQTFPQFCSKNH